MPNKARRGHKNSLYGKSMDLVVNIIKVSLFYIVKKSFRTTTRPSLQATENHEPLKGSLPVMDAISAPLIPGRRRLQERERGSKPYLIDPCKGKGVSYMICEGMSIDRRASDYIRRVHEKNRNDSSNTSRLSSFE